METTKEPTKDEDHVETWLRTTAMGCALDTARMLTKALNLTAQRGRRIREVGKHFRALGGTLVDMGEELTARESPELFYVAAFCWLLSGKEWTSWDARQLRFA